MALRLRSLLSASQAGGARSLQACGCIRYLLARQLCFSQLQRLKWGMMGDVFYDYYRAEAAP